MTLADAIAVQLMKGLENGQPIFNPDVDLNVTQNSASFESDLGKQRLLARRACMVLAKHGVLLPGTALKHLKLGLIIVLVFIALSATTICFASLLVPDAAHKVSVQGFFLFGLLGIVLTIPTLLVIISAVFQSQGDSAVATLMQLCATRMLIVSRFLIRVIGALAERMPVPTLRNKLKSATIYADDGDKLPSAIPALFSIVERWPSLPPLAVVGLSTLCWLVVFTVTVLTTAWATTWDRFDYKWHSSLFSNDQKLSWVTTFGWPLSTFGVARPGGAAMAWVSGEENTIAVDEPLWRATMLKQHPDLASADTSLWQRLWTDEQRKQEEAIDGFRTTWTKYLLGLLLFYGVILRLVLIAPLWLLWHRASQQFMPDLSETYFRDTLSNLRNPPIGTEPGSTKPVFDRTDVPLSQSFSTGDSPPAHANTADLLIVGYETRLQTGGSWRDVLELPSSLILVEEVVAETRSQRHDLTRRVTSAPPRQALILVTNAAESPDQTFQTFLTDLRCNATGPVTFAVLTGLERLRQKHRGNPRHVAAHLQAWRDACIRHHIRGDQIIEYDVEHLTAGSRDNLRQFWKVALLAETRSDVPGPLRIAGRFRSAGQIIVEAATELHDKQSADSYSLMQTVQKRLLTLYNQEAGQSSVGELVSLLHW